METASETQESVSSQSVLVELIRVDPEGYKLTWKTKNYSDWVNTQVGKSSEVFQMGLKNNHKWELGVYPLNKDEFFRVSLKLVDSKEAPGFNCFLLSNVNCGQPVQLIINGSTLKLAHGSALMRKGNQVSIGVPIPGPGVELINNALTIQVFATFITQNIELKMIDAPISMCGLIEKNEKKLAILKKLRNSISADVTVKAASKEFKAHGDFLKDVCPAMLLGDASGKKYQHPTVDVSEFDDDVVKGLLDYLYEGETDLLKARGKALGLWQLARKYGVDELKKDCETAIRGNFKPTVDTVLDDLLIAHDAGMEDLKKTCLEFFNKNTRAVQHSKSYRRHVESSRGGLLLSFLLDDQIARGNSS